MLPGNVLSNTSFDRTTPYHSLPVRRNQTFLYTIACCASWGKSRMMRRRVFAFFLIYIERIPPSPVVETDNEVIAKIGENCTTILPAKARVKIDQGNDAPVEKRLYPVSSHRFEILPVVSERNAVIATGGNTRGANGNAAYEQQTDCAFHENLHTAMHGSHYLHSPATMVCLRGRYVSSALFQSREIVSISPGHGTLLPCGRIDRSMADTQITKKGA